MLHSGLTLTNKFVSVPSVQHILTLYFETCYNKCKELARDCGDQLYILKINFHTFIEINAKNDITYKRRK